MQNATENKVITIYDIAKEAGVSPSTVSRVLNNNANVRREKREKIQSLIEKYNFTPNAMARGLSDTKSGVIGIVAADVRNPYYAEVFVSCENAAREAGYTVLLCNSLGETEREFLHLDMLQEQRVEAIIQLGGRVDDLVSNEKYVEKVNQLATAIPMVVTGKLDGTQCYEVQIDAARAMELLMEYLYGLGHRKIALAGGRRSVTSTYKKHRKYKEFLEQHKIKYREEYVIDGSYDYETGYFGMNQLLELEDIPTAVIAINDFSAAGVMRSAAEHGYRIPQDISVVSYDNTNLTDLMMPKMTSIDYDYVTFGRKLVDTAIAAAQGRKVPMHQKVIPSLVVRESSAPPPDGTFP
ncbi:MAG: LacI family transcriptional regulator [Blautia sp.]|nr:LacI family transcriptional regulator [Blautia sp.]MCM1200274.1 LacI family transcriptional regulator [Bacteroides fragilis]